MLRPRSSGKEKDMRASFYEGSRTFRTGPISRPSRAPEEVLLRVRRAGICGTDLHIFQGHLDHRIPKGGIIGHETFAEVVEAPARRASGRATAWWWSPSIRAASAGPAAWAATISATA
jgi:D-arabinose 1-dehydrogenase-like Zn-dependent alcohol dehydrogenase